MASQSGWQRGTKWGDREGDTKRESHSIEIALHQAERRAILSAHNARSDDGSAVVELVAPEPDLLPVAF